MLEGSKRYRIDTTNNTLKDINQKIDWYLGGHTKEEEMLNFIFNASRDRLAIFNKQKKVLEKNE